MVRVRERERESINQASEQGSQAGMGDAGRGRGRVEGRGRGEYHYYDSGMLQLTSLSAKVVRSAKRASEPASGGGREGEREEKHAYGKL